MNISNNGLYLSTKVGSCWIDKIWILPVGKIEILSGLDRNSVSIDGLVSLLCDNNNE